MSSPTALASETLVELRSADQRPTHTSLLIASHRLSSLVAAAAAVVVVVGVDHNYSRPAEYISPTDINARLLFAMAGAESYGAAIS